MTMKIHCLNQISKNGLKHLTDNYELTDKLEDADAVVSLPADWAGDVTLDVSVGDV